MFRKLLSVTAIAMACSFVAVAADDEKKPAEDTKGRKFDKAKLAEYKAKMFEKMDTNTDGKVSKEEYTKSVESMFERMKDRLPAGTTASDFAAKRFDTMDANKDGSISKEEFEKADFGGFGGRPGGNRGKGKAPDSKPAEGDKKPEASKS